MFFIGEFLPFGEKKISKNNIVPNIPFSDIKLLLLLLLLLVSPSSPILGMFVAGRLYKSMK